MRLDKYISNNIGCGRTLAKKLVWRGQVTVNGRLEREPKTHIDPAVDRVEVAQEDLRHQQYVYLLLHKPAGYLCSTKDEAYPSALNLIDDPRLRRRGLHFAGRLDVDTTGAVLISDHGAWSHAVMAPARKLPKRYRVQTAEPIAAACVQQFAEGLELHNEKHPSKPAELLPRGEKEAELVLREGRYHQVKRMFAAVGNRVIALHRLAVGPFTVDDLPEGTWRQLDPAEALAPTPGLLAIEAEPDA